MATNDAEQELLRSVALENARSILEKRQRAERQLVAIKDALEQRTGQLARSVAMMQATLESTFDGIVVTDGNRREDILGNAPQSTRGFFVVPKVVE